MTEDGEAGSVGGGDRCSDSLVGEEEGERGADEGEGQETAGGSEGDPDS